MASDVRKALGEAIKKAVDGLVDECACAYDDRCPLGKSSDDERCSIVRLIAALVEAE